MKHVFGYENFINKISVRTKSPSGFASVNAGVFETAEYILGFGKNKADWTYNIQYTASLYDTNYKWIVRNKDSHYSRSEEHTSELQSRGHLVCRLLLEKKKKRGNKSTKYNA